MNSRTPSLLGVVAAAVAILALGACRKDEPVQAAPLAPPSMPQGLPQGIPPPMMAQPQPSEVAQRITATQQALLKEPKNAKLWVELGNDYFDTHQAQLSVDAYAKALEIQPNDPDVLTDQGVMYRELKNYDRAIANFEKAAKLNPRHLQSLYNAGVVYGFDLHNSAKAVDAFNRVIAADPSSPQAAQARNAMKEFQQNPPAR
ncbi:MAG TPA: tetratricopeptide repeat protein [Anaeromyxobacteraceae bacterium]|nr:tetratricopeptide repeat protein [Anaeromyxobacteraceae bacterium]